MNSLKITSVILFVSGVFFLNSQLISQDLPSSSRNIIREKGSKLQGKSLAILIGVENYDKAGRLQYCIEDVKALAAILRDSKQFSRIELFHDELTTANRQPTYACLQSELPKLFKFAQNEGYDRILIHFSGHGEKDPMSQKLYLAPRDIDPEDIPKRGLAISDLKTWINQCTNVKVKLLCLDCCYAGQLRGETTTKVSSEVVALALRECRGLLTLASSQKDERSQEWNSRKQGVFTFWLCEGLKGAADTNKDLIVDSDELHRFVYEQVLRTSTLELSWKQHVVSRPADDWMGVAPILKLQNAYSSPFVSQQRKDHPLWRSAMNRLVKKLKPKLQQHQCHILEIGKISPIQKISDSVAASGIGGLLVDALAAEGITTATKADTILVGEYGISSLEETKPARLGISVKLTVHHKAGEQLAREEVLIDPLEQYFPDEEESIEQEDAPIHLPADGIDGSGDLSVAAGITVSLPTQSGVLRRHEAIQDALSGKQKPFLKNNTIATTKESLYAIEILKDGKAIPPELRKNNAFVSLKPNDTYEVRVHNNSGMDAAVSLHIDGLSVFKFSQNQNYQYYIVHADKPLIIPGWYHTNKETFQFLVKNFGEGRFSALKDPTKTGVITAKFHAAWDPKQKPPTDETLYQALSDLSRSKLETDVGPPKPTEFQTIQRMVGLPRDLISIRYNRDGQ